jgi:DNA-binding LacI/PurR family transcriptional regulator
MAKKLGYRPNLAARCWKSNRTFRVSVNTLKGTRSFRDAGRAEVRDAARSLLMENVDIEFRTYPYLGE